jgi:hypothetical protein
MNHSIRYWVTIINKLNPDSELKPECFIDTTRLTIDIPKKLPAKKVNRLKLADHILRHIDLKADELVDDLLES